MSNSRENDSSGKSSKRHRRNDPLYTISAVSDMYGIHPQTLRLYDREGLLKPDRSSGNTRLYSKTDLEKLEMILRLTRDLGLNRAGAEIVLDLRNKLQQLQKTFAGFILYLRKEFSREYDDFNEKFENALKNAPESDIIETCLKQINSEKDR